LKEGSDLPSDFDSDGRKGIVFAVSQASSYATGPMKIINNIFNSDLVFNLSREDDSSRNYNENGEVGISGRDYALVPGEMWLQAFKWHSDCKVALKERNFSASENDMADVYPLQLRLSISHETDSLGVRISKKDNAVDFYRRACKIFSAELEQLRIWDFSGQTTAYLLNDKNRALNDPQRSPDQDILLELQVYGLSDIRNREMKKDEMANGFSRTYSNGNIAEAGSLGLTGLQNMGNTCFMNSALQCLAHTPKLVDYFLGDYKREINHDNPLGMNGEIASAFGDLMKKLWAPGASPIAPRTFKSKLAHFAPQFSGFNQHDSQELLAFLLDGLHEDLNRVKNKPYFEAKDGDGRPDEEVADEYWNNHLARNDSIIVDVCQGQFRSTLVCPDCNKSSVTFDPFMYVSLPLPSTSMRTMTLTVVGNNGTAPPSPFTVNVPKRGKFEDLIHALSTACSITPDETLLVAEVYNNRIIRFITEPSDSLSLIRDDDRLIAYRLPKSYEESSLVLFMHHQLVENYICGKSSSNWKQFGIPLMSSSKIESGSDIRDLYMRLLAPFSELSLNSTNYSDKIDSSNTSDGSESEENSDPQLQFYKTDEKAADMVSEISMNEPIISSNGLSDRLNVIVHLPEKFVLGYNTRILSSLPEVFKSGFFSKRPQETVTLYNCLEAFLKQEPLGPDDMWYCPVCKKHCQASKKLDLWRLPKILVIHLKRFSYNRYLKNKLETFVDFPTHNLDLSSHIAFKNRESNHRYMLYAISNHYGSMGGGHYTAFVHHGGDRWYDFDDSHVSPISEDKIKTSAAYVLFYRRIEQESQPRTSD
jgi:ubiquitin carboxyl-terminal hydrolase 4/11/15